jgi:hypothetical protein
MDVPSRLERFLKCDQGTPVPVGDLGRGLGVQRHAQHGRGHRPAGIASLQDDGLAMPVLLQESRRLGLGHAAQLDAQCLDPGHDQVAAIKEESDDYRNDQQHQAFAQQD